jgi:hypothetical protein
MSGTHRFGRRPTHWVGTRVVPFRNSRKLTQFPAIRADPEMLYPAMVVSDPCDRKKSQGWGTELWGRAIMEPL